MPTFYVPTADIITNGSPFPSFITGDQLLLLAGVNVVATGGNSAVFGSGADGVQITVKGTLYGYNGIFLGNGSDYNTVTIAEGGLVGGSEVGISLDGLGNRVNVSGEVTGSQTGIDLYGLSDSYVNVDGRVSAVNAAVRAGQAGNTLHLSNAGFLTATTYGVTTTASELILANAGTISAQAGVFAYRSSADILNTGTIQGNGSGGSGIYAMADPIGYAEKHHTLNITNSGTIQGEKAIAIYGDPASASDVTATVRNSGAINGDILFDRGNDLYDGATGALNGKLEAGAGHDTVLGGANNDRFFGGDGLDSLRGDGGNDSLDGGANDDEIYGGTGDDTLLGGAGVDQMHGGDGDDGMAGGDDMDLMFGDAGSDFMLGQGGTDQMEGGAGNDTMQGGDGDDLMLGGDGDDFMQGGIGLDEIFGGAGNDTVNGGGWSDHMEGGDGIDLLSYQGSIGGVTVNMATGEASGGDAIVDYFIGFEQLMGSGNNDSLTGTAAADTIWGGGGDDLVQGAAGNDVLRGGDGNDTIVGGAGRDVMYGNAGADTFRFGSIADMGKAAGTRDIVRDFQDTIDKIDLSLIDPSADPGDQAFAWRAGQAFTGTGVAEVRWTNVGNDVLVQLDTDGDKVMDGAFLVAGKLSVMVTDFIL